MGAESPSRVYTEAEPPKYLFQKDHCNRIICILVYLAVKVFQMYGMIGSAANGLCFLYLILQIVVLKKFFSLFLGLSKFFLAHDRFRIKILIFYELKSKFVYNMWASHCNRNGSCVCICVFGFDKYRRPLMWA